ncbi:hypothetical protein [Solibacillus sp. FSL K6-1554]|uniref:hypothetical protein n=1 Tax=Solibacillus sp. FSL K6-1554 TaxID=2921472 RepID=UPI0030F61933
MCRNQSNLYTEVLTKRIMFGDTEASAIQHELQRLEAGCAGEIKLKQTLSDYFLKRTIIFSIILNA